MEEKTKVLASEREDKLWQPAKNQTSSQPKMIQNEMLSPQWIHFNFKFCVWMYFNSSWTKVSFIDMMANFWLEIWKYM